MEELLKNTDWTCNEEETGTYFESFFLNTRNGEYSFVDKLEKIYDKSNHKISLYYDHEHSNYLRTIKYDLSVLERKHEDTHKLAVVIKNKTEIRAIVFTTKNEEGREFWWYLSFNDDYTPRTFATSHMSGPGWPTNIKFKRYVDIFRVFFDELEEHCPEIKKGLKKALRALNLNAIDCKEEPGTISFKLR